MVVVWGVGLVGFGGVWYRVCEWILTLSCLYNQRDAQCWFECLTVYVVGYVVAYFVVGYGGVWCGLAGCVCRGMRDGGYWDRVLRLESLSRYLCMPWHAWWWVSLLVPGWGVVMCWLVYVLACATVGFSAGAVGLSL
ncbi:hypothetical protein DSM100238_0224 [Bifidobacterium apri]|uniref:Transmembrane protein n=1 Tax=Bifidobacterium apri TaxID=1769423 RepID=A0A6A2W4X2_9BIFI|nr:hypothetical protein DSM100238_0224 [Bifidobacterium apri]